MSTKVEIWNLALTFAGARARIESVSETNSEANYCRALHQNCVDSLLNAHDWGFASKYSTLALVGDETGRPDYDYEYTYPTDCMHIRELLSTDSSQIEYGNVEFGENLNYFELGMNYNDTGLSIFTDIQYAALRYTKRITDCTIFPPFFVTALAYTIAAQIAVALREAQPAEVAALQKKAEEAMELAKMYDGQQYHCPNPSLLQISNFRS